MPPKYIRMILMVVFGIVGITILGLSHAGTPTDSFEAESGTPTSTSGGQASIVPDSGASKGEAIRFGLAPPSPSNIITRWSTASSFQNPIHFIDAYYNPPNQFDRAEVSATIETASGTDGYYFSSFLFFPDAPSCTPNCYAYMGLQTVGAKSLPPGGEVDKMAIFSVWDSTSAAPNAGVTEVNFDGEGVGKSLRVAYDWQVGRTYQIGMYYNPSISNTTTTYWTAYINDTVTGASTVLGSIKLPAGLNYAQSGAFFHERYSGAVTKCSDMNSSQVKYSNLNVTMPNTSSGRVTQYINNWTIYQANVSGCNNSFWVKDLPGAAFRSGVNTPAQ